MSEDATQSPDPGNEQPKQRKKQKNTKGKRLLTALWHWALEHLPKPIVSFLRKEFLGITRGWHFFVVLLFFGVIGTFLVCRQYYDSRIKALETNSERLTMERDKAREQLAPWFQLANSHMTNTPLTKRLDALLENVSQLKANEPAFSVYMNTELVSDGQTIDLGKSRNLDLTVANLSDITVENVTIDMNLSLETTNLICKGWEFQAPPKRINDNKLLVRDGLVHLRVISEKNTSAKGGFEAPRIFIATNLSTNQIVAELMISSKGSKVFPYRFNLKL